MRRLLLGLVFLSGCHLLQDTAKVKKTNTVKPTQQAQNGPAEIIDSLINFNKTDMSTPQIIPSSIKPELDVYSIDTRVVIEGQTIKFDHENEKAEAVWWSRTPEDVRRDLDHAEKIYEKIGVKFRVSEIVFKETNPLIINHFVDANIHPNTMTIVYMLPNTFPYEGYSSAPWENVNRGIIANYLADEWTVAHEIGHYFGLMHPFDEDYVGDTPPQKSKYCTGPEHSTPNCHNIMNYCDHEPKHVTSGQVDRFRRFLRAKRLNHYVRDSADIMLQHTRFPTPAESSIIFNVNIHNAEP